MYAEREGNIEDVAVIDLDSQSRDLLFAAEACPVGRGAASVIVSTQTRTMVLVCIWHPDGWRPNDQE
ncbi:hypothetical protein [Paracoccus beibuensis]|uniref:hypothetical protein n=1 Tax=Paracoccus beibuensis TaxID=547602 RepID=UPI00223FB266|nr:hypothetical protein [Paracoccus beibuensis]